MLGTLTNNRLISRLGGKKITALGACFLLLGSSSMLLLGLIETLTVFSLMMPMVAFSFGTGLINPTAMAGMLTPFPTIAGTAGAAMGASLLLAASLWSFVAALLHEHNQVPLASILLFNSLAFILTLWLFSKFKAKIPVPD